MNELGLHTASFQSFFIEMYFNDTKLGSGTAFFAGSVNHFLLFTNKHIVTGKNIETNEIISSHSGIPNNIKIAIPIPKSINKNEFTVSFYQQFTIPLYENDDHLDYDNKLWFEHSNPKVDVVGLKFNPSEIDLEKLILKTESWHTWGVGDLVNVVGYPFGLSADGFPIWMTGYIASEPAINQNNAQRYLVDCRTREGNSGSPVIGRFRIGDVVKYKGKRYTAKDETYQLIGVYSGRVNKDSDIGVVWKMEVIKEILENDST